MTVKALGAMRPTVNVMQTRTPGADFYQDFTAAFRQEQAAPAGGEPSPAATASLTSLLGQVHMELASRRGISNADEEAFASILNDAYASDGVDDPVAFLKTLSPDELDVIGRVHGLAVSIDPATVSKEGAANLLLPDGYTVDLNRDGMEDIGPGRTMHFPPRDAPQAFVDAWTAATEGMTEMDAASYGLVMHGALYGLNLESSNPGDTRLTERTGASDLNSYRSVITGYLDMLDHMGGQLAPGQYQRDKDFFNRLRDLLDG